MSPILAVLALLLRLAAGPDPRRRRSDEIRLTIVRDPYTSSDQVTLCRVRADNRGGRRWPGSDLAFEARARRRRAAVRERGRFGLELAPYGSLETLVALPGRHDRFEVVRLATGATATREPTSPPQGLVGTKQAAAPSVPLSVRHYNAARMKVLVVGGGGREHALCWSLHRSPLVEEIFCAPGNPGIAEVADCLPVSAGDIVEIADLAEKLHVDLTVVGPGAAALARDRRRVHQARAADLRSDAPGRADRDLQGLLQGVLPPPQHPDGRGRSSARSAEEARKAHPAATASRSCSRPTGWPAERACSSSSPTRTPSGRSRLFFQERVFGAAGDRIIVEEFLRGQEASFLALFDGEVAVPLPTARDYKKVYDGDRGPNTGGMGAHSPAGVLNAETASQVLKDILWPTLPRPPGGGPRLPRRALRGADGHGLRARRSSSTTRASAIPRPRSSCRA